MRVIKQLTNAQTVRFVIVGVFNTLLNFTILDFSFYILKTGKIASSIIATICAVSISFFLNRGFVFRHKGGGLRQPIMFAAVTVTGVLIIQNTIYIIFLHIIHHHSYGLIKFIHDITGISLTKDFVDINLSNVAGSIIAMVWNYNGYRLFVFKPKKIHEIIETPN